MKAIFGGFGHLEALKSGGHLPPPHTHNGLDVAFYQVKDLNPDPKLTVIVDLMLMASRMSSRSVR